MDPVTFEGPLLDTSISIVQDGRGTLPSGNQLGIADKDTVSACVALGEEHHEAHECEIERRMRAPKGALDDWKEKNTGPY